MRRLAPYIAVFCSGALIGAGIVAWAAKPMLETIHKQAALNRELLDISADSLFCEEALLEARALRDEQLRIRNQKWSL